MQNLLGFYKKKLKIKKEIFVPIEIMHDMYIYVFK